MVIKLNEYLNRVSISPDDITGIILLSTDEYEKNKDIIPSLDKWWWLRSPSYPYYYTSIVCDNDSVTSRDMFSKFGVRPALLISSQISINSGSEFTIFDHDWVVLRTEYKHQVMAICKDYLFESIFNDSWEYGSDYNTSYIKRRIEDWLKEQMSKVNNESINSSSCTQSSNICNGSKRSSIDLIPSVRKKNKKKEESMTEDELDDAIMNNRPFDFNDFKKYKTNNVSVLAGSGVSVGDVIINTECADEIDLGTKFIVLEKYSDEDDIPDKYMDAAMFTDLIFVVRILSGDHEGEEVVLHYDIDEPVGEKVYSPTSERLN